jgi:hypothetical protein
MGEQEKAEFLGLVGETLEIKKVKGGLDVGYWHELYTKWERLSIQDKNEIVKLNPEVVARITILMMGDPGHNLQPQNEAKYEIVDLVIRNNPEALTLHQPNSVPGWLMVLRGINVYQDGTLTRLIRRVRTELYPGGYDSDFDVHKEELEEMIRKTRQ